MEKFLRLLAEQNRHFNPNDSLSKIVDQVSHDFESELSEEELFFVQAARGDIYHKPVDPRKENDQT